MADSSKKIRITLKGSPIGRQYKQHRVLRGLGLRKLGRSVVREDTPAIRGMVDKVVHLVSVEEVVS
jgi:large subunit ribosomal protein L30